MEDRRDPTDPGHYRRTNSANGRDLTLATAGIDPRKSKNYGKKRGKQKKMTLGWKREDFALQALSVLLRS